MTDQRFFDPGALNHRLSLESIAEAPDGCGGVTVSWQQVAEIWGRLRPRTVKSALEAQQLVETASHTITMRYRSDVTSGWRFTKDGRTFVIITVTDPDERGRYLVCDVEEEGR